MPRESKISNKIKNPVQQNQYILAKASLRERNFRQTKRLVRDTISSIIRMISPSRWKQFNELNYWEERKKAEVVLSNVHFEHFYTTHFGLDKSFYKDKVILDIGCGPRGSLEWASMEYIEAPSEKIPLNDAECDAVFSFNSLDHVENVEKTLGEIKRVTRPGGILLLLVEVNHPPTDCEPHKLTPGKLIDSLNKEFHCQSLRIYKPVALGMYQSIRADKQLSHPEDATEPGYLSAKFIRMTSS